MAFNELVPRAVVGAAVVALTMALVPAAGATRGGHITLLTTHGAASADVTFSRSVRIAPMKMDTTGANGWAWSGCGRVRGFYFQPLTGNALRGVGAVDFADLRYGDATDLPVPGQDLVRYPVPLGREMLNVGDGQQHHVDKSVTLPRGRYRLYVLGEGRCWVHVPVDGSTAVSRTATRRATMQYAVDALGSSPAVPGARALAAAFPITVTPRTFAVSLLHEVTHNATVGGGTVTAYGTCVEKDSMPGCAQTLGVVPPGRTSTARSGEYRFSSEGSRVFLSPPVSDPPLPSMPLPTASAATDVATWYSPGWLTTGVNTAKVTAVAAPATALQAAMFALDLG
jgi:hypothetical protein